MQQYLLGSFSQIQIWITSAETILHTWSPSLYLNSPFQLGVARRGSTPPPRLTKCVIPVAWYSYSCANPLRYPLLTAQLVINHWQLFEFSPLCGLVLGGGLMAM